MTNKIPQVATTSSEIENENLEKLRKIFPQFVKDGQVDFDALQEFFEKEGLLAGPEKFGLSWNGKSNAFKAIRLPATGTLVPQDKESKHWDETGNLFIEGDNLEVLKLLQKHYREKVKMIYIDPPYNRGKDLIYKDNFIENISDYYERTGQTQEGIRLTANTDKNGRYHSDWLTAMYPRLFLARNLLKDDGVVFISIDDNEFANLRLIMTELFGENNVEVMIWHKVDDDSGRLKLTYRFRNEHEYIIVGYKNKEASLFKKYLTERNYKNEYTNPDNDPRGPYKQGIISHTEEKSKETGKNYFVVETPAGKKIARQWRVSEEEFNILRADNRIYFGKKGESVPSLKVFINEKKAATPISILDNLGTAKTAGQALLELFDGKRVFDYPKPVELIKHLIEIASTENGLILDFYAGSGTTAHAVMALNEEDEGGRKRICVQLQEETEEDSEARKAGFTNIAQIARERIRRAGAKIAKVDTGFKALVLEKSNYRQWNVLTDKDDVEKLKAQMQLFAEKPLVDKYDEKSVVYEIMLKEGFDLNSYVESPLDEKNDTPLWTIVDKGERPRKMVITFAKKVTKEDLAKIGIGETDNEIFVCFDSALDDTTKVDIVRSLNLKVM